MVVRGAHGEGTGRDRVDTQEESTGHELRRENKRLKTKQIEELPEKDKGGTGGRGNLGIRGPWQHSSSK